MEADFERDTEATEEREVRRPKRLPGLRQVALPFLSEPAGSGDPSDS